MNVIIISIALHLRGGLCVHSFLNTHTAQKKESILRQKNTKPAAAVICQFGSRKEGHQIDDLSPIFIYRSKYIDSLKNLKMFSSLLCHY
jgi:hypothetical protein